jgi:dynein heavy chain
MLEKAIQGSISMNEDLDEMVSAFEKNAVPSMWRKYCYETMKPLGSWFVDFKKRMEFLHSWSKSTPNAYWISCFFFPQGLLTSFLQTFARKYKVSIDSLSFKFKATEI